MRIKVTEQHIENGVAEDGERCPIALALVEQCGGEIPADISVGDGWYNELVVWKGRQYELPDEARSFIEHFDNQEPVEPFEFELEGFEC